jgi:hypothetical protein
VARQRTLLAVDADGDGQRGVGHRPRQARQLAEARLGRRRVGITRPAQEAEQPV